MNTFTADISIHNHPKTGKPICCLQLQTNALIGMTHYNGDIIDVTIHASDPQELKDFCKKITEAGDKI